MYSRKLALALAKRYRTCPPEGLKNAHGFEEQIKAHLAICPHCSGGSGNREDGWESLCQKLGELSTRKKNDSLGEEIQPGQLRFIRQGFGEWREGLYYNPPVILVKQTVHSISDDLLVYQTYHDIHLAGPGDLIVPDNYSPIGELFVETWNIYTLKGSGLGPAIGAVPQVVLDATGALEEAPNNYPNWAILPPPLTENDPRDYFRELEVEVGYLFSSITVSKLMKQFERPPLTLAYSSPDQVMAAIRKKSPGVHWVENPATIKDAFSMASFPAEELALAAQDSERKILPANLVLIRDGAIEEFIPVRLELFSEQVLTDGLEISGRFLDMPEGMAFSVVLLLLNNREPDELEWDGGTGYLFAHFRGEGKISGKTPVAIVFEII